MDSVKTRKLVLTAVLVFTAVIVVYGFFSSLPHAGTAAATLIILALLLFLGIRSSEAYDPHQLNLVQEKSYRITLKSVVATAMVTGLLLLAALYATAVVIGVVTAFSGYETLSFQVFADAVSRLHVLMEVPATRILWLYAAVAVAVGTGFWILYPYLPTENEELAGPVAFLASWIYLLSVTAVFAPLPVSDPTALALDAAIVTFWGHFFAVAYEDVEKYVP